MNNFDENNEFVKRPASSNTQVPPRNIPGQVRRPSTNGTQNHVQNRPANSERKVFSSNQRPISNSRIMPNSANVKKASPTIERKAKAPKDVKSILKNVLIFFAMLIAMLVIGFSLLLSSLYVAPEKANTSYSYIMGENELSSLTVNNVLYMNITELSDMCSFIVSGTKDSLRYTASNEEYIEFTIGSRSAKINGDIVNMEGAALVRESENVWIPLSFAELYINGINIEKSEEEHIIAICRTEKGKDDEGVPYYSEITFRIKGSQSLEGIEEDPDIGDITDLDFVNDLSEYEQYMNPEDRDAYLILVNKTNHISEDDIPENLISIVNVRQDGRKEQMVECAEKALEAMFIELKSAGYTDVSVTSGYRSYQKQVSLFTTYLQREMAQNPNLSEAEAKEIVLTYSAFPGTSEHQTGLCCDMHNLSSADVAFAKKEAYTWLKENCHKFGFVIRFPEDKVDITGYSFEPWHYRFVGRYHATRMYKLGMCLEEYTLHLAKAED